MNGRRPVAGYLILFAAFMVPGALAALGGGGSAAAGAPPVSFAEAETDLVTQGQLLYEERCGSCHGAGGTGTAQGPGIVGLGPAAYLNFFASAPGATASTSATIAAGSANPRRISCLR